jgi:hypothetical protein
MAAADRPKKSARKLGKNWRSWRSCRTSRRTERPMAATVVPSVRFELFSAVLVSGLNRL